MKKILVADDEKEILLIWLKMLKNLDSKIEVHTAENGELAMMLVEAVPKYDLIITDYKMPKMNGIQLLNELRKNSKTQSTQVFFFTGYLPELADQLGKMNKVLMFEKPVVTTEMIKYISFFLALNNA